MVQLRGPTEEHKREQNEDCVKFTGEIVEILMGARLPLIFNGIERGREDNNKCFSNRGNTTCKGYSLFLFFFLSVRRQSGGELPELKLLWCLPTICLAQALGRM